MSNSLNVYPMLKLNLIMPRTARAASRLRVSRSRSITRIFSAALYDRCINVPVISDS